MWHYDVMSAKTAQGFIKQFAAFMVTWLVKCNQPLSVADQTEKNFFPPFHGGEKTSLIPGLPSHIQKDHLRSAPFTDIDRRMHSQLLPALSIKLPTSSFSP